MTGDLELEKRQARGRAGKARTIAHEAGKNSAPMILAARGLPFAPEAGRSTISAFYPYRSEIDTMPLLGRLAGDGWTTALPIVIGPGLPLLFRQWMPGAPIVLGEWDIPRPPDDAPQVDPDVLLVPLLAFDRKGYRLGYGGGFYDRSLAKLRALKPIIAIGVAYASQEWEMVPHGEFDQPLDYVMTENEMLRCG